MRFSFGLALTAAGLDFLAADAKMAPAFFIGMCSFFEMDFSTLLKLITGIYNAP